MKWKVGTILLMILLLGACNKQEEEIILTPDAGPGYTDVENDGYVVTLSAQPAPEGQTGIWRMYIGEHGRFEDPHDPHTRFYGEPGETYLLGWELSCGDQYKAATISVSFKPLHPVILSHPGEVLTDNVSLALQAEAARYGATGRWELVDGDGGRIESPEEDSAVFIGRENREYTVRWTLTYGSKSAAAELTFTTDTLRSHAGDDELDIITYTPVTDPKYYNLDARLPAGGTGHWQLLEGTPGKIYLNDDPNSLFEAVADTTYTLLWSVQVDDYTSSDTVRIRFRGKWGVWVDPRDNQAYRYVRIGDLEWMADNFNYACPWSEYGRNFYYGQSARANIVDGHPVDSEADRKFYGRLYNYFGAKDAAPEGWRLPTRDDFKRMQTLLGGDLYFFDKIIVGGETGLDINFAGFMSYSYTYDDLRDNFINQDKIGYYLTDYLDPRTYQTVFYTFYENGTHGGAVVHSFFSLGSVRYIRDVK